MIDLEFTEYVSYNQYGGIEKRIPRNQLEAWLRDFQDEGKLALGVWELQYNEDLQAIEVRISPKYQLDSKDDNWHTCDYVFVPFI